MMFDTTYEEQRDFNRMKVATQIIFTVKGMSHSHQGLSQNLSANGLRMTTDTALSIGDEIELTMESSHQQFPPLIATGKVIRQKFIDTDSEYRYDISLVLSNMQ